MKSPSKEELKVWIFKLTKRKDIDILVHKLGPEEDSFKTLLKITKEKETSIAAKASWTARAWAVKHPQLAKNYLSQVFDILEETTNDPVARNLSGMLIDFGITPKLEVRAIDLCFHLLGQNKRAVAIHSNALGILSKLAKKYPELRKETFQFIESHPNLRKGCIQARLHNFTK